MEFPASWVAGFEYFIRFLTQLKFDPRSGTDFSNVGSVLDGNSYR